MNHELEETLVVAEDILVDHGLNIPIVWALGWLVDHEQKIGFHIGGAHAIELSAIVKEIKNANNIAD